MATPFVSGTLALMKTRYPTTPMDVLGNQVLFSARNVDQTGDAIVDDMPADQGNTANLGYGVLDASLAVSRAPELNDARLTATSMVPPSTANSSIEAGDGLDWYKVSVTSGQSVKFDLTPSASDIDLYVYMDDGTLLGRSMIGGASPETVTGKATHAGRMYAIAAQWSGTGDYSLTSKAGLSYFSKPTPCKTTSPYSPVTGTLTKYKAYRWTGKLAPKHTAGATTTAYISVSKYNKTSKKFEYVRKYYGKNSTVGSFTQYTVNFPLGPGRYKLTPVAPEDTAHLRSVGTANYVTVQ